MNAGCNASEQRNEYDWTEWWMDVHVCDRPNSFPYTRAPHSRTYTYTRWLAARTHINNARMPAHSAAGPSARIRRRPTELIEQNTEQLAYTHRHTQSAPPLPLEWLVHGSGRYESPVCTNVAARHTIAVARHASVHGCGPVVEGNTE